MTSFWNKVENRLSQFGHLLYHDYSLFECIHSYKFLQRNSPFVSFFYCVYMQQPRTSKLPTKIVRGDNSIPKTDLFVIKKPVDLYS